MGPPVGVWTCGAVCWCYGWLSDVWDGLTLAGDAGREAPQGPPRSGGSLLLLGAVRLQHSLQVRRPPTAVRGRATGRQPVQFLLREDVPLMRRLGGRHAAVVQGAVGAPFRASGWS